MPITSNRNLTPYQLYPLSSNEIAANGGFTHKASITADDLTSAVAVTAQTLTLAALKSGDIVQKVAWRLKTAFNSADAAYLSCTMAVGHTGTTNYWIAASEVNALGTTIFTAESDGANETVYTAANILSVTFLPVTSAKTLNALTSGQVEIYVELSRTRALSDAAYARPITTK